MSVSTGTCTEKGLPEPKMHLVSDRRGRPILCAMDVGTSFVVVDANRNVTVACRRQNSLVKRCNHRHGSSFREMLVQRPLQCLRGRLRIVFQTAPEIRAVERAELCPPCCDISGLSDTVKCRGSEWLLWQHWSGSCCRRRNRGKQRKSTKAPGSLCLTVIGMRHATYRHVKSGSW
jgi:hypothetical protein